MLAIRATIAECHYRTRPPLETIASVVVAASASALAGIAINEVFSTIWRLLGRRADVQLPFSLQFAD